MEPYDQRARRKRKGLWQLTREALREHVMRLYFFWDKRAERRLTGNEREVLSGSTAVAVVSRDVRRDGHGDEAAARCVGGYLAYEGAGEDVGICPIVNIGVAHTLRRPR